MSSQCLLQMPVELREIQLIVLKMPLYLCFYPLSPPLFLSRSDDSKQLCHWSEVQYQDHKRLRLHSCEAIKERGWPKSRGKGVLKPQKTVQEKIF